MQPVANFKIDVLQQLVNPAYIAMCQYDGPVKAGQLLAQALKEVEPEAESRKVNLRDFLKSNAPYKFTSCKKAPRQVLFN